MWYEKNNAPKCFGNRSTNVACKSPSIPFNPDVLQSFLLIFAGNDWSVSEWTMLFRFGFGLHNWLFQTLGTPWKEKLKYFRYLALGMDFWAYEILENYHFETFFQVTHIPIQNPRIKKLFWKIHCMTPTTMHLIIRHFLYIGTIREALEPPQEPKSNFTQSNFQTHINSYSRNKV